MSNYSLKQPSFYDYYDNLISTGETGAETTEEVYDQRKGRFKVPQKRTFKKGGPYEGAEKYKKY